MHSGNLEESKVMQNNDDGSSKNTEFPGKANQQEKIGGKTKLQKVLPTMKSDN